MGKAADAVSGICTWHGFAGNDGYAGAGQRGKEPAAVDDAQSERGRAAQAAQARIAARRIRKRHRVYDTAERHESANAANGRADLRGAAS